MFRIFNEADQKEIYPPGHHKFEYETNQNSEKKIAIIEIDEYYTITEICNRLEKNIPNIDQKVAIKGMGDSISYKKYVKIKNIKRTEF